ncbi:MAG: MmgE/PrpD family protein [Longimicrobiales bacterium]|nr:MmgE/PrpD family protein [Longimicrobiales bacterium]
MDAPTRRLAHAATGAHELDEALCDRARLLLFDYLAVAIRGSRSASSVTARGALAADSATPSAVLEGTGLRTSTPAAALLNAISGHGIEMDDTNEPASLHAGVAVWPTVLALGDERGASPAEMLAAAVAGYDAACRVGRMLGGATAYERGFHPTGVCGVFGAAAAAGRLLGLSTEQMVSALGIAATSACGSMEYLSDGAWTKRLNPGLAAANGILAARLASGGFRGPQTALEGRSGFLRSYGNAESLGRTDVPFELGEGIRTTSVKLYPCCRYMHGCIDLLIDMATAEQLDPEQIQAVGCGILMAGMGLVAEPVEQKRLIHGEVDAQFSMPFAAALALTYRRAALEDFQAAPARARELAPLIDRVECYTSERVDAGYPERWAAEAWVRTAAGRTLRREADGFRGSPRFPASWDDVRVKAEGLIGPELARQLAEACGGFTGADLGVTTSLTALRARSRCPG